MAPTKGPKAKTSKRSERNEKTRKPEAAKSFEVEEITAKLDEVAGANCGNPCASCKPIG